MENAESKVVRNQQTDEPEAGTGQRSGEAGQGAGRAGQDAADAGMSGAGEGRAESHEPGKHSHVQEPEEHGHVHEPGEHDHAHEHGEHAHSGAALPPMDPACRREVEIEIPVEVVDKQRDAMVQQYAKQARVPGFRKGKVPPSVVKNRFSDEITSELVEHLVPQYYQQAVAKAGLRPVSQPHIHGLEFTPGEPMRFKAVFEVLPEFEVEDYTEMKVEKPAIQISDAEVDAEIAQLQERQASYDPVNEERGAEKGEFVQVSFEAMPKDMKDSGDAKPAGEAESAEAGSTEEQQGAAAGDEAQLQPVQMEEVLVEIGGANTIPEFTEHLSGAKAGEERSFEVHYPEDFPDQRLAGLTFNYKVKVNAIKKKNRPELNDDFAKELSQEFQTLEELKARIRENMEMQRKHQAEHDVKGKLMDELLSKHDFPVPRSLVEHQIDLRLERGLRALASQGMKTEEMRKMDFGRLRAGQREAAVKEVKSNVLLAKIAIKEKIQVSEEELENEIAAMAMQMQQPVDEVKKRLVQDNAVERLRDRMRSEKALNFLYERAG